jgi:hypothetical protein
VVLHQNTHGSLGVNKKSFILSHDTWQESDISEYTCIKDHAT